MQDIAGCRVIVTNEIEQDRITKEIQTSFPEASIMDRRKKPSHGYRAVHIIVPIFGKWIEIQVRTRYQHLWAELSEKLSDSIDPAIKYGGGPVKLRNTLAKLSLVVKQIEKDLVELKAIEHDFTDSPIDEKTRIYHDSHGRLQKAIATLHYAIIKNGEIPSDLLD